MSTRTFEVTVDSEFADDFRAALDWLQGVVGVVEVEL